jgi:hypothetical protein
VVRPRTGAAEPDASVFFLEKIADGRVAIATPVPTVDGAVGLRLARLIGRSLNAAAACIAPFSPAKLPSMVYLR